MATATPRATPSALPYEQLTDTCFAANIGGVGLGEKAFARALDEAAAVLDRVRAERAAGGLPVLDVPGRTDDLPAIEAAAARLRGSFDHVVVLGAGGSSLGGRTLCALANGATGPRLHFADNIDPLGFETLLGGLDGGRSGFIAISKPGATAETLAQTLAVLDTLGDAAGERLTVVTQPGESPLRRLAERIGCAVLDHDPEVGGRYAALTVSGLLPAFAAGLDGRALRAGAGAVLDAALTSRDAAGCTPAVGAAIAVGLLREHNLSTTVLMPYCDRLAAFGLWFRQLWAESLGKDGTGTTPLNALGATDQHSQLQLWLNGPPDKMFTLVTLDHAGAGPRLPAGLSGDAELAYLEGRAMGDLLAAEQRATAETLARHGRPVRLIRLASLDERTLGALLMHFMLETIITAGLIGVNPFDQPAVDEGKALARVYLAEAVPPGKETP